MGVDVDREVEPLTPVQIDVRMRTLSRRLLEAIKEHDKVCREIGEAEANYKKTRLEARIASCVEHPDRRVGEHDDIAEQTALPQWQILNGKKWQKRALAEEMHSLRQVMSVLQTQRSALKEEMRG